jgi:hypothetical protein
MAGQSKKAEGEKPKKNGKSKKKAKAPPATAKVSTIAKAAAEKAADLATNPLVAEIVAATLVAAAAAIRDPKKARQLAAAAGDELQTGAKTAGKGGEAIWQLALEVGRKSLEALGNDGASKPGKKAKAKKKKSA